MINFPQQHGIVLKKLFDSQYSPNKLHSLFQSVNLIIIPISPHLFIYLYDLNFAIFAPSLSTKLFALFSIWKN